MASENASFSSRSALSDFSDRSVLSGGLEPDADAAPDPYSSRHLDAVVSASAAPADPVSHIWGFLFSKTEAPPIVPISSTTVIPGRLLYFKPSHFTLHSEFAELVADTTKTRLGEGACYLVDRQRLSSVQGGLVVAVKTPKLRGSAAQQQTHVASLILRELQVLTHPPVQTHPNIASILGYSSGLLGQDSLNLSLSLIVELASGGTLRDFLAQPRGSGMEGRGLRTKARLLHDVASGLDALHGCGIIHGDVKLENVLVFTNTRREVPGDKGEDGEGESDLIAKLSDFGYALPVDPQDGKAKNSMQRYMGTYLLNAPEVRKNPEIPNEDIWKCDVYSYGLLVWEAILDGKRYFSVSDTAKSKEVSDVIQWLADLPQNDLLRLALKTVDESCGASEPPLVSILRRVLKASLQDDKNRRKPMAEIVKIFRGQKFLAAIARARDARMEFKPEPFVQSNASSTANLRSEGGLSSMPESVRQSILEHLRLIAQDESVSTPNRHRAYLDLSNAYLSSFSGKSSMLDGMTYLRDAAAVGCVPALVLYCRLSRALPSEASAVPLAYHAVTAQLASNLLSLPSSSCLSQWLWAMEEHYQQEALETRVQIVQGTTVMVSACIARNLGQSLAATSSLDFEALSVVPLESPLSSDAVNNPCFESQQLLEVACRLGLLDLIQLLLPPEQNGSFTYMQMSLLARGLVQACRGAHLDVVEYLARLGVQPRDTPSAGSSFHWLFMFPIKQRTKAMDVLIEGADYWITSLHTKVDPPGVDLGVVTLSGTPLEFAIAIGDDDMVKILVDKSASLSGEDTTLEGFGDDTFKRAVANHLAPAVELLLPHELRRRRSDALHEAMAKMRLSRGEKEFEPFGLFDVGRSKSSLSLLLLHGSTEAGAVAVNDTIDVLLASGIASINDIDWRDKMGPTALAIAVRWAPCSFDTSTLAGLISRGGNFFEMPDLLVIIRLVSPRAPGTKALVMHELLKSGLLDVNSSLLSGIIETGDAEIMEAILDFTPVGISAGHVLAVDGHNDGMTLLQAAVLVPGAAHLVKLLIDRGAPIDETRGGFSPFELSLMKPADLDIIEILITSGAATTSRDFPTVIHSAARLPSYVNGCHILTHLLRHDRLRELATTTCTMSDRTSDRLSPAHVASYAANVEAIAALMEMGIEMPRDGEWDVLRHTIMAGKRPHINPVNPTPEDQEDAVYEMKLRVERLVLYLLDRLEPGHGRTALHIAMELGNFQRVVELVEEDFDALQVPDGAGLLPLHYMEDAETLQMQRATRRDVTEATVANARRLSEYVSSTLDRQKASITSEVDSMLADIATATGDKLLGGLAVEFLKNISEEPGKLHEVSQQIKSRLEELRSTFPRESTTSDVDADAAPAPSEDGLGQNLLDVLQSMPSEKTETEIEEDYVRPEDRSIIVLDGDDKPEDLLEAVEKRAKRQAQELGSLHPETTKASEILCELFFHLNRKEDGQKLLAHILQRKRTSLPDDDPEVFYTWRDHIYATLDPDNLDEAVTGAKKAMASAKKRFGASHTACLIFAPILALRKELGGDIEGCLEEYQNLLKELRNVNAKSENKRARELKLQVLIHLGYHTVSMGKLDELMSLIDECLQLFRQVDPGDFLGEFGNMSQFAKDVEDAAPETAQIFFERLLETCSDRLRPGSYCVLEARRNLAKHFTKRDMLDEARKQNRKVISSLKLRMGAEHLDTLHAVVEDVKVLQKQGLLPEAKHHLLPTVKILEQNYGNDHMETLGAKTLLTELLLAQEEFEDWEIVAREVARGYGRLDPMSDQTIDAERAIAFTLGGRNRPEEARQIAMRCLDKTCEVYGENHERTLMIFPELQRYTHRCGLHDMVIAICERALKIAKSLYGPRSGPVADWLSLLGSSICIVDKKGERGIELLKQSIELTVELNGGKHTYSSLLSLFSIGKKYRLICREEKGLKILENALEESYRLIDEEPHRFKIRARIEVGRCYDEIGHHEKALPHMERAVREARDLWGDWNNETIEYLDSLVGVLSSLDRDKDALPLAREVLDYRKETVGSSHPDTISATDRLAELYFSLGKHAAADVLWRRILVELEKEGDDADLDDLAYYRHQHAKALIGVFGFDEAKRLAVQSVEYYRQAKGEGDQCTLEASVTLAKAMSRVDGAADAITILRNVIKTCGQPPSANLEEILNYAQIMLAIILDQSDQTSSDTQKEAEELLVQNVRRDDSSLTARIALFNAYKRQGKYALAEEHALGIRSQLQGDGDEFAVSAENRIVKLYMLTGEWDKAQRWAEPLWTRLRGMMGYQGNPLDPLDALETLKEYFQHAADEDKALQTQLIAEEMKKQLPFQLLGNAYLYFEGRGR